MTDWEQLASIAAVISALVVTMRYLYKYVLRPMWNKTRDSMFGIGELKTDISALSEQVTFIADEMRPNGGASIRDCLNRIEVRQVLQEQRQWAVMADMDVGVFESDAEGNFTRVNRKYLRLTGRSPDEVVGSGWINTVANRDRERVEADWDRAITEEREFEAEFLLITPEDSRMNVSVRTYKMVDEENENQVLGYLGMLAPLDTVSS